MNKDFTILYQKYKEPIFSYIYYLSGNRTISEEICQEVFLKVYLHIDNFQGRSSFKTWLYRIAKNTYLNFIKKRENVVFSKDVGQLDEKLIDSSYTPEDHLLNVEINEMIQSALKEMGEKYRTFIILRDIQQLTYQEISEITETNLNSVKVTIYRAREEFRKIYIRLEEK
ncbi:RNA polymerase sigma factor [Alkaliphilus peptidifermentans]|uniref:RNA polymerase sigma-70 factor, ECF subfamily n=1 Tax=Alkaliphilus peptidifermentans DSM 18978 TaxID=1120976 RepID=A0A1G5JQC2_9FIRM|nr:RNA polymerase sigma factor [Alkaliphilus peptidifermentans]SCY90622.1 RNA polymerase sigma-70 factor, ECF subfamily [Alkaliphilus peptidifermentans DSM 18978]